MKNKTYKYIRLNILDDINDFLNQVQPENFRIVTIDSTRKVWGIFQKGYAVFYWSEQNPIPRI